MKKKLGLFMAACIAATTMASGCSVKDAADAVGINIFEKTDEQGNAEISTDDVVESKTDETAGDSVATSTSTNTASQVTLISHEVECAKDGKILCTGTYSEIILSDEYKEKYPKLAEKINLQNTDTTENVKREVAEAGNWRLEDTYTPDHAFEMENNIEVIRADDKLFSTLGFWYSETGGAHPNHGVNSVNIDPNTGEIPRLDAILADPNSFAATIRKEFEETYPEILEEVDSFHFSDGGDPDTFRDKLVCNTYTWLVTDKGLEIYFSPYEIASYAVGEIEMFFTYDKYPDLIKSEYQVKEPLDMTSLVAKETGDKIEVEPYQTPDIERVTIENPTWSKFSASPNSGGTTPYIKLTKTKEESTDFVWLYDWQTEHGFPEASTEHTDEEYTYLPCNCSGTDEAFAFDGIDIFSADGQDWLYSYDLTKVCNGPDNKENKTTKCYEFIRYCTIYEGILYLEIGHLGYAEEEPNTGYIVAINPSEKKVLFRTEPLTGNAMNFKVVGSTIICAYGFTAEPDYIYLLDRYTGERYDQIPVKSAVNQIELVGDTLYVAAYNTTYEFAVTDR